MRHNLDNKYLKQELSVFMEFIDSRIYYIVNKLEANVCSIRETGKYHFQIKTSKFSCYFALGQIFD